MSLSPMVNKYFHAWIESNDQLQQEAEYFANLYASFWECEATSFPDPFVEKKSIVTCFVTLQTHFREDNEAIDHAMKQTWGDDWVAKLPATLQPPS